MKNSMRALLGLVLLDAIIVAGAWWMIQRTESGAWNSNNPAESITMITTTAGMMAGFASIILLLAFVRHRAAGN
jgi:hypothetical protein